MDRRQSLIVMAFALLTAAAVAPAVLLPRGGAGEDPLAAGSMHPAPPFDQLPAEFPARLEAAVAGDTWRVITPEGSRCVRLLGIDSPEPDQPHWMAARVAATRMAENDSLRVLVTGMARDHCLTGRIVSGQRDFGLAMVEAGFAWYNGDTFDNSTAYAAAQESAREKKLGLWAGSDPVPPWVSWDASQKNLEALATQAARSGTGHD